KSALGVGIIVFTIAGISVSFAILDRQRALEEVAGYNMVWAVSQAIGEFYRFEERIAAYAAGDSGVDKDEVQLRFDLLNNRLDVFSHGDVKEFTSVKPEQGETVQTFERLLAGLEPLVQQIERPGNTA